MLNKINPSNRPAVDLSRKDDMPGNVPPPFSSKRAEGLDQMRMIRSAAGLISPAARAEARAQEEVKVAQEKENREVAKNVYPYLALAKANSPDIVTIPYTDAAGKTQVATLDSVGAVLKVSIDGKPMFSIGPKGQFEVEKGRSASDERISSILQSAFKESSNALGTPGGGFNKPVASTPAAGAVPATAAMMLKVAPRRENDPLPVARA